MAVGRGDEEPRARAAALARWRRGSTVGAMVTASAMGLRDALDDRGDDDPVVEEHEARTADDDAVVLYFVPGVPEATLALVRPWLLPGGTSGT